MLRYTVLSLLVLASSTVASPLSRVVNGTDAADGEIPYIVSLRQNNKHICGGSILDATHILTAAHCVTSSAAPSTFSIQYGVTDIVQDAEADNVVRVRNITYKQDYKPGNGYPNDVAVVELDAPLGFSRFAQPVKLPPANNATPESCVGLLSGWGYSSSSSSGVMTHLQKVDLLVYKDDDCESLHAQTGPTNRTFNICAGVPEGGKGQCSGDSGGPLVVEGVQVGIVSWSIKPCTVQGYPGVYTKVSTHINWIMEQLK